jgi:hypothetical protein
MSQTRFREWRYTTIAGKKKARFNGETFDPKNYAQIEYKTQRGTWSKPVNVGSIRFKKLLLSDTLNIRDFPQYRISKEGRRRPYVYFDQNNLRSNGRQVKSEVLTLGSDSDDKKQISYTLMFYARQDDLTERMGGRKGFRLDAFSYRHRMLDGSKAYPLFHRSFHIVSSRGELRNFLRRFANPWKLSNNTAYQYFWDKFIPNVAGQNSIGVERGALDSIRSIAYGVFDGVRELTSQEAEKLDYRLAVAMHDRFMNCGNLIQQDGRESEKHIYPLHPNFTWSYFPKNGCFYREFMATYKPSMVRTNRTKPRPKYKNFCYAGLWKIVHGDADLPDDNDFDAWGACWNDMIKIFRYYRLEATLYDGFGGSPRLHYHPEEDGLTIDKNLTPRHFRFVWSNNHVWVIDKNGKQDWSQKLKNKKEELEVLSSQLDIDLTQNHCNPIQYPYAHLRRKQDTYTRVLLNSIQEIYAFLQMEDDLVLHNIGGKEVVFFNQYIIITNLDLEYIFLELRQEYDLQASIDMRGGAIDKLKIQYYYNKHVIIQQAYTPNTAQCIIHDIKDYNLMDEFLTQIKKLLFTPQYASVYNDQVFDLFQKFRKGGLQCCFDYNNNPECILQTVDGDIDVENPLVGCSDFNRFYISDLLSYDYLPTFTLDDYFLDYDHHILEDLTLYYVKKVGSDFVYPFYMDDLCFGVHLRHCPPENYVIHKYIRPSSYHENPLQDLFVDIYDSDLPDDLKKSLGNITCGWLVQKSIKTHRSFFSENRQEVELLRRELGGCVYPLHYHGQEVGHAFSKCFSKPLLNGFYFLGLLLLDGTHWKMHVLKERLDECGLQPFAIKTDCIYHLADQDKYAVFREKYPDYFSYSDKNDFSAIGRIKYELTHGSVWNQYVPKALDFDFSPVHINSIPINNEWIVDEFVCALEKYNSLLLVGHGGYGKSTSIIRACRAMNKKLLILVRMHPLSDEWYSKNTGDYEVMTAEAFFRLNPFSHIPFGFIDTEKLKDIYAIMLDDALLCHLKIWNQWFFFQKWCSLHMPHLRFIGTADHLQMNMLLNDDYHFFKNFSGDKKQKVLLFASRLFKNVIRLQENKRLTDPKDRELCREYIKIVEAGDEDAFMEFRRRHMHVVDNFYEIPMHIRQQIRHFIVAENRERPTFNRIGYCFEHGQFTQKWQVGHVVMSNVVSVCTTQVQSNNKYASFQHFRIEDITDDTVKLRNTKRKNHCIEVSLDVLKKNFAYPFARTCHSWQGMTCHDKLVIYGTHHLYKGITWDYTADSRATRFDDVWIILPKDKHDEALNRRAFLQSKIDGYIQQDLARGFVLDMTKYIDVAWIELELRRSSYQCHYCNESVYYAWTIDRYSNILPHYTHNCHLCCLSCNRVKR